MHERLQGPGRDLREAARPERDHALRDAIGLEDVGERGEVRRWVGEHTRRDRPEAFPEQILPERVALLGRQFAARGEHDLPVAVPVARRRLVDAPKRVFEAAPARAGEAVITAPADRARAEPAVAGQPEHGRSHHPRVEPQQLDQADEAAQPYGAAVRCDRVAVDRDDERIGAQRPLGEQRADPVVDEPAVHEGSRPREGNRRTSGAPVPSSFS